MSTERTPLERWERQEAEIDRQQGWPDYQDELRREMAAEAAREYPKALKELQEAKKALDEIADWACSTDSGGGEYYAGKDASRDAVQDILKEHGFWY
ncbi:hypothetical protein SEA_SKOG_24 [Gordonia phage Skog]|uniref:Uncharacterized protein n=1 Tax=Gordonia phage Skog TaxID=2704033 RepID=A0A6G6XJH3_9CAUD|nr:hypothetical protein KHQ85_gp024 [Gordonia phage Skog]QIG58176.1 hypothetical protein SEA_SKOG_24 [Gordonia phage Skog]